MQSSSADEACGYVVPLLLAAGCHSSYIFLETPRTDSF